MRHVLPIFNMQIHELKVLPPFYAALQSGEKTFEIRKDDRGFQKGDKLLLREHDPMKVREYTGQSIEKIVTYVTGWEQKPGFVVMAIS